MPKVSLPLSRQGEHKGTDPKHVAIIMDGNGRWAAKRGLPRTLGHKKGATAVKHTIEACIEIGIAHLTLYAFSTENWQRDENEVGQLMALLRYYLEQELDSLHKNGICLHIIGDRSKLDNDIVKKIEDAELLTARNTVLHLHVALSYGSRQEMAQATASIALDVKEGKLSVDAINADVFSKYMYTQNIPDPDLLIRTGGEQRLSNFLLWQMAYTELLFLDILWPDFKPEHLHDAAAQFRTRERRYGT